MKKTNKIISILLVLAMMLTMAPLTAFATVTPTTVEVGGVTYYKLRSESDLDWFASRVNSGNTEINGLLTADIEYNSGTMSASTTGANVWIPIGSRENPYSGIFNGQGYTISGLFSKDPDENPYLALFACTIDATIANVAVTNFYFESTYGLCAGIVSYSAGTRIYNCYAQGSIYAKDAGGAAAGICASVFGHNKTEILNCLADVSLKVDDPSDFSVIGPNVRNYIGGIICMGDKNNPVMVQKSIYITDRYSGSLYSQYALPADFAIYDSEGMPASKLATGEIAYILGDGWGQKLGTDPIPEIGNENRVDYGYESCDANAQKVYTNYATNPNYPDHYDSETDGDIACDFCGENLHIHSFEYTANGNVITATCSNSDGNCTDTNGGTLTISAPEDLYTDGRTVKEAVIDNQLVEAADYTVSYLTSDGSAPTTEGTYTASVTVGGATASVEFTLSNYAAKVTDKDGNLIGNYKTLEEAADAVRWDYENATITLLDDITLDSTWGVGGVVTIDLNGKTLNCTSGDTIFVQARKGFAVTVEDSSENKTGVIRSETGSAIDVGVGSKFILNSGTITAENDYAIMAVYSASSNSLFEVNGGTVNGMVFCYADSVVSGGTFNDMFTISYNYKQNKFSGGIFNGGIKINSLRSLNDLLADGYHFRNAQGKVVDGSSEIIEEKVIIEKGADFSADAVVTAEDVVYNGAAQEPDVTVTIGGKILTEGKDYTLTFANNINAGMATVTVTGAGDYEGEIVKTFEIAKADSSIDVYPVANKFTYNGKAQALIIAGSAVNGTMVYSLDGEKYSLLAPTGTNAGEYTVYYKVEGDSNHNDSEPETLTVTIGKKSVTASATVADKVYDGTTTVDSSAINITLDGIIDGDDVVVDKCTGLFLNANAGNNKTVQIAYSISGDDVDNYEIYEDYVTVPENEYYFIETKANILPRDIADAQIVLGDALTYNGTEQTQSIASVTVDDLDVTYTVSGNTAKNVGVYQLTVTGTGNFTGEATALYEIAVDVSGLDYSEIDGYYWSDVKSTDKDRIEYVYNQLRNTSGEYADEEKEAEWFILLNNCNEMLLMIRSVTTHLESFKNTVDQYDIETVTSDDYDYLEELYESEAWWLDFYFDNYTDEEIKEFSDTLNVVSMLKRRITETKSEYDRVIAAANGYDEATVTSADKDALVQLNEDIYALALTDNVTAEEKANLQAAHDKVFGLIDKLVGISDEIKRIIEAVDKYVFESVKSSDKADIQQLIADIKALLDTQNLTADERALLETEDETCDKLVAKIDETVAEINRINEATNVYDEATVTSADKEAIEQLIADIKALTDGDNITESEREQLVADDETLDALLAKINATAEEIARIEETVNGYDEATVKSTDKADLEQLKEDIQALIDSTNTTENEKTALGGMLEKDNALIDVIDEIEQQIEDIGAFENNFNPEKVTSDDKAEIEEIIAEIESVNPENLTDEQKAEYAEIKADLEALLEEIEKAGSEVDSIGAELEMLDKERVTIFWEDEIEALKAKIDELLADENMGEAEKAKLEEYKVQCDNLIEIIDAPVKYFSMRLFYLIWDAFNWFVNRIVSIF